MGAVATEEPGCCHCRYDGGEGEKGKKKEAMNALDCRRSAGVLPLPICHCLYDGEGRRERRGGGKGAELSV